MRNSTECLPAIAKVDGWPINIADQQQAVDAIIAAASRAESFAAFTLNLDHVVKLRRDPSFRSAYQSANFVTADGAPVAWLASKGGAKVQRTTGADLVIPLAEAAARENIPVFLFGTTNDVLGRAGRDLAERTDHRLTIAGTLSPERDFDPMGPSADAALEQIVASGARICFAALGAPKQELFAARAVAKGIPVGFVCIGAALDFIVGAQIRAPQVMQSHGLEWLWRLATNPRRLAGRYFDCGVVLAQLMLLPGSGAGDRPRHGAS